MLLEQIFIYSSVLLFATGVVYYYVKRERDASRIVEEKIAKAKEFGLHEPVSLHPQIDLNTCIKSAACVRSCPEQDILGILDGGGTLVNASNCVGHGACFHGCPVEAISLVIGTEKRGAELPHVNENYESNIQGIYIAGELGGMGLIKNSVEQGRMAVENMVKDGLKKRRGSGYDLIIVGAGPAGISASLMAKKLGLRFLTLEQDTLGGSVLNYPRAKIVMTAPMDLPLHGKAKLYGTSKMELLDLWYAVLSRNDIDIQEHTKVETIRPDGNGFSVTTSQGDTYYTQRVLLAIGRRGSPRKLNVPGEELGKVAYRLLEPERIAGQKVLIVGGGDSAVEAALLLADKNEVVLSYRRDKFWRIKPQNRDRIHYAMGMDKLKVVFNSNLTKITEHEIHLQIKDGKKEVLSNDLVYIFAGGELPFQFLKRTGIQITKRFGYTLRKYG
ncbi:MAG TPA: 4Fe-4S dicluster domain-containing protein [Bacteroidetes bacterium]|nr:4Fe-4S dicluster domain-containing protein [Bacteroidota bacterium]